MRDVRLQSSMTNNRKALADDVADLLIDQEAYVQGYQPPLVLADILLKDKKVAEEFQYTDINIKTKYNI